MLEMDLESILERLRKRHHGNEKEVDLMKKYVEKCDSAAEDEKGIVTVKIIKHMNPEEVLKKVLENVK